MSLFWLIVESAVIVVSSLLKIKGRDEKKMDINRLRRFAYNHEDSASYKLKKLESLACSAVTISAVSVFYG